MLQLLRRQHQWSQPKPNTHIRSITSLISDFCSQWNWKDAISAKNCLSPPPHYWQLSLRSKQNGPSENTQHGDKRTHVRLLEAGGWVVGLSATGWAYPEDLFSLKRWREQPDRTRAVALPTTECISMSTKISLPTTNSASLSDWSWQILAEDPASVSRERTDNLSPSFYKVLLHTSAGSDKR